MTNHENTEMTVHTTDSATTEPVAQSTQIHRTWSSPPVDVLENEEELLLVADLPGVQKEDVHVRLENGVIQLEAVRRMDHAEHSYRRSFTMSDRVDIEGARAELDHGILSLHLPKAPEMRPREIPILAS